MWQAARDTLFFFPAFDKKDDAYDSELEGEICQFASVP